MADKEALEIPVSAVTDESSVKKAIDDLGKEALSSLKEGCIEIPVKIKEQIPNASKELKKAHGDLIKQLEDMSRKGFSSSEKDATSLIDSLDKLYLKFKRIARQEGKSTTKQSRGLTELIGGPLQTYRKGRRVITQKEEINSAIKKEEIRQVKKEKAKEKEDAKYYKTLGKGASRREAQTPGAETKLGLRHPNVGGEYITKKSIMLSDISAHETSYGIQTRNSEKDFYKDPKHQVKTFMPSKEEFEKAWEEALSKNPKKLKNMTEFDKAKDLTCILLDQLGDLIKEVESGKNIEKSSELFSDTADAIYKISETIGTPVYETAKEEVGKVLDKYYKVRGKIGVAGGKERTEGITSNEDVIASVKGLFTKIEANEKAIIKNLIDLEKETKTSTSKKISITESNSAANKIIKGIVANKQSQKQELQKANKAIDKTVNATKEQINFDRIENADERIADSKDYELNKQALNIAEADANSGLNPDHAATEMFSHMVTTNRLLGDTKKTLCEAFGGGKVPPTGGGSTTFNTGGKPLEVMLASEGIITTILANLQVIVKALKGTPIEEAPKEVEAKVEEETKKEEKSIFHMRPPEDRTLPMALKTALAPVGEQAITEIKNALVPVEGTVKKYFDGKDIIRYQKMRRKKEEAEKIGVDMSTVITSSPGFFRKIQDKIKKSFSPMIEADRIMQMNKEEQMRARARRMELWGENRGRNLTDTGDIAAVRRRKQLFGWMSKQDQTHKQLFQDIQITPGFNKEKTIDTTSILKSLNKVLSGPEMFKAQTGGALRNLIGSFTGYLGMPSLEKSRAEAEGLNQVMANVRKEVLDLVQAIQSKEMTLKGMEEMGKAKFTKTGMLDVDASSSMAQKTFVDLEEQKNVLHSALAEVEMIDQVVGKTGYKIRDVIKQLGFVMPELMQNNTIIHNINAGLDKSGKALKFKTRTAEVLNYTFQLMSRHIGQMLKRWMLMLNPINWLKKAFSDFASYDVKWQRTMNVIKYNLRHIIRPMMQWIAQQLVNMIGLVNALVKGIGSAFGKNWDLFDKDAANAEKIREELEAASDVSAGFDELHDIGSNNDAASDLLGDIYTPQWTKLNKFLEDIGKTIGNIINAVSNWSFWDWLILVGAALAGYIALKWLINVFSGKVNPLQTVAEGFSFLEKAVGWALLIWAFTSFTKALGEFVTIMKSASWEDIAKALITLGSAFAELVGSMLILQKFTAKIGTSWQSLFGLSALVGVFSMFTKAIVPFLEVIEKIEETKTDGSKPLLKALGVLMGAFTLLAGGAGLVEKLTMLTKINWQSLLGLSAVVLVFSAFTKALVPFVEALQGVTKEQLVFGLAFLAGALMAVAVSVGLLGAVFTAIVSSGVGLAALGILAAILLVVALVIVALAEFVRALGEAGEGIKLILEGVSTVIQSLGEQIVNMFIVIGEIIVNVVDAVAQGIVNILTPILEFMDGVIGKVVELSTTIAKEIGATIRTIVVTVGNVILGVIDAIMGAIPQLLDSILNFCRNLGPAIENTVDAICRSVTKLVNFVVSAVEYMANLVIGAINKFSVQVPDWVPGIGGQRWGFNVQPVNIPRFTPHYEQGTNYVPNDGLAYLHEGEAVIPKKYNRPYETGLSTEEQLYMRQMINTMKSLDSTMKQGIPVNGEFVQRGSDLVAVVNKTKSQTGADLLSNVAYAR